MRRKKERIPGQKPIESNYFKGEHMSLEVLKKMKSLHGYNQYLFKTCIPDYPKVDFHIANISHVTTQSGLISIMESSGFKGGESDLLYWGLHVDKDDIEEAESRYLNKEFSASVDKTTGKRKRQDPFLEKFTTSPAFSAASRYGNYKFTFPIKRLLELYRDQCCDGEQPIMRIYEMEVFQQAIAYTVVVHSPVSKEFDGYPILSCDDPNAVCVYQSDTDRMLWRAQAICETHDFEMIIDKENGIIDNKDTEYTYYYVYDEVALAFHLPKGQELDIEYTELYTSLKACDKQTPYIGHGGDTFDFAIGKVKDFKPSRYYWYNK